MIAAIALTCHGLEKGFTMPDFRVGFGESKLKELLVQCRCFIDRYGKTSHQLRLVIQVIYEYRLCHQRLNAKVPASVAAGIDELLAEFPDIYSDHIQIETNKTDYFAQCEKPFPEFAVSRHSVRDFSSEPVPLEKIKQAIALAQCAPSACNRQSSRVIIVKDKEKIAKVFEQHGGNRGFGHTVDTLLLIAGYLPGYHGSYERNWVYVDGGIFTMNLAYALHYHQIGAVILNWNMEKEKNRIIYDLLEIPPELTVFVMIAVGNVPDEFRVCSSPKKQLGSIIYER